MSLIQSVVLPTLCSTSHGANVVLATVTRRLALFGWCVLVGAFAGCDHQPVSKTPSDSVTGNDSSRDSAAESIAQARHDSVVRGRPGYVIDSILPVAEEIRRFQATLDSHPTSLSDGAASRSALVTRFVRALETSDTGALAKLVVTRAEFGHLIYPTSPNVAPPYRQSPELVWLTRSASTEKASRRLFQRFGGKPFAYVGYACDDKSAHEGANTVWSGCAVRFVEAAGRDTTRLRLFGSIVERGGQFKFLSLTNGL